MKEDELSVILERQDNVLHTIEYIVHKNCPGYFSKRYSTFEMIRDEIFKIVEYQKIIDSMEKEGGEGTEATDRYGGDPDGSICDCEGLCFVPVYEDEAEKKEKSKAGFHFLKCNKCGRTVNE